ncbi:864_t:CDS:2 [Cetraspora pellucida]|uniref:864_t:CDS:1 n=1 Tax=Cetraspora pellucida TaxID=1433469 RepID=A0ACA9KNR0_9GLOM|nr:864_t:CDS:2 [Cetraspora pellucida]
MKQNAAKILQLKDFENERDDLHPFFKDNFSILKEEEYNAYVIWEELYKEHLTERNDKKEKREKKIILVEVRKYEDEESILLLVKVVEGNQGKLGLETKELIIKLPKRKKRIQPQVSSQQQTTTKIELPPTRA